MVETGKRLLEQKQHERPIASNPSLELGPTTILHNNECGYTELHQIPFVEGADQRMLVESVEFDKLNARDHHGNTPLIWAVMQGNEQLAELLIDQGSAVNMQNFVGETALIMAAARGFDKICTLLVENGADTRLASLDGSTPLHMAAAGGHLEAIKSLVLHGAFVNVADEEGDVPIHYAVREEQRDAIELLVKYCGADPNLANEDGETPYDLALDLKEDTVDLLSGAFNNNSSSSSSNRPTAMEIPEHRLYFGEENDVSHREPHPQFAASLTSY